VFSKILIANRGEIALRIIRAARELGIKTVAVYSKADADALHVKFADEAVCIGPAPAALSYLNVPSILSAAEVTGAEAVHPGYGFLAENAEFAEVCEKCRIHWIGPPHPIMRLMGDKIRARNAMTSAGVPILPGSGLIETERELEEAVERTGFPLIIKASAGGGGRGMKIVEDRKRLVQQWQAARAEAQAGFANPDVYVERYVRNPRHVELQVVADTHGNHAHLGERECSIQRRHQKLVEEAPSVALSEGARERLIGTALEAMRSIGYQSLGTLEFLLDEDDRFYFMEMNTRLQVEHTVTEMVTGIDLVREQILIAAGEKLSFEQRKPRGHSIELRITAEDPETFAPSPGRITGLNLPGGFGVRVDTHIYEGYVVPPHYDSLLAKLIVRDNDRPRAICRLRRCLEEFVITGIKTNIPFHRRLVEDPQFQAGEVDTNFVARFLDRSRSANS
jgi:acetyl-CoA carboxylase, biotin carboxylase subunit